MKLNFSRLAQQNEYVYVTEKEKTIRGAFAFVNK